MNILGKLTPWALGLVIALLVVPCGRADTFEEANRAFAQGHYAESARGYESVLKTDGYSAAVLFDLGNANLRAGQTGDAILDYERAKWLAPHDPDITANLHFARRQAGLPATSNPRWESAANVLSPNAWSWLASASLVVLCLGILGAQLRGTYRYSLALLNTVSVLVLVLSCSAIAVRYEQLNRAIVPGKNTLALISPFAGAKTAAEFSAGQTVSVERAHGEFSFVRDLAGHSGWVSNAQIAMVAPASS